MKKLSLFISGLLFITITFSQTVGIGTSNPNPSAVLELKDTAKGFLPPRMTTAQRDSIKSPATGLTIYNTTTKGLEIYNGTLWHSTVHYIGELYAGGTVFYIDELGQHGLIVSPLDVGFIPWSVRTNANIKRDGVGAGIYNTEKLINQFGSNCAAFYCSSWAFGIYGDWYLPSKYELNLLYLQNGVVFVSEEILWSSNEASSGEAWAQNFASGAQVQLDKTFPHSTWPIRRF